MEIKFYKVVEVDICYEGEITYGYFSTYEKAAELMNQLTELDGFGVCKKQLRIVERVIKLDTVDDWVNEFITDKKIEKEKEICERESFI